MPDFFHYSGSRYDVLAPQCGPRRHGGEASNAVGKAVVYLFDKPTPDLLFQGEHLRYEHRVTLLIGDLLLEQEDPKWMPNTWIYLGQILVVGVREWNDETRRYEPVA